MIELYNKLIHSKLYEEYIELKEIYREIYIIIHNMKRKNKTDDEIVKSYNTNDIKRLYRIITLYNLYFFDMLYYMIQTDGAWTVINRVIDAYDMNNIEPKNNTELIDKIIIIDINDLDNMFMILGKIYNNLYMTTHNAK